MHRSFKHTKMEEFPSRTLCTYSGGERDRAERGNLSTTDMSLTQRMHIIQILSTAEVTVESARRELETRLVPAEMLPRSTLAELLVGIQGQKKERKTDY
jgi:hypothetical protein